MVRLSLKEIRIIVKKAIFSYVKNAVLIALYDDISWARTDLGTK